MPPLWYTFLEWLGRLRIPTGTGATAVPIGHPRNHDIQGGDSWQSFTRAEVLFDLWGPVRGGPWEHFHCVPLFAAMDAARREQVGPLDPEIVNHQEANLWLRPSRDLKPVETFWSTPSTWVILDLPGVQSVALAARFVAAGFQPVCTFNHWPHPKGLLQPETILAQLLRYSPGLHRLRPRLTKDSPPLWICDRHRLGTRQGKPREFDNRYYLEDAILPSRDQLRSAGIDRILYVAPGRFDQPLPDIWEHLDWLYKGGFPEIGIVHLEDQEYAPRPLPAYSRPKTYSESGFQRSAAGGFGKLIPEPSSSGG